MLVRKIYLIPLTCIQNYIIIMHMNEEKYTTVGMLSYPMDLSMKSNRWNIFVRSIFWESRNVLLPNILFRSDSNIWNGNDEYNCMDEQWG